MGYRFEDFKAEQDNKTVIVDGKYGYKLKISIFNPCVPLYYKEQLLKMLNAFIENNGASKRSIDSVDGEITAYIDMDVAVSLKYAIQLYVWKDEGEDIKDYTIWKEVLPSDGHFPEFKDCIMGELERMAFGSEG